MFKETGKLFGKISIVDIGVVLLVLLLAAGILLRFSGAQDMPVSDGEPLECVVLVQNVRSFTVDALRRGGPVYDRSSKQYVGEVTGISPEPGKTMLLLTDGTYHEVETENRYNVYVTISFTGKAGDGGYYTDANKQLTVGSSIGMDGKYFQCDGTIKQVRKAE